MAPLDKLTLAVAILTALMTQAVAQEQRIYLTDGQGRLLAFDPATGARQEMFAGCDGRPRISPDGRSVAYTRDGSVWVRALKGGTPRSILDLNGTSSGSPPVWSSDGTELIVGLGRREDDHWVFTSVRVKADGSEKRELRIPPEDGVHDWSTRWLLTASSRNAEIGWQLYVMRPNGTGRRQITEGGNPFYTRFSPDGKSVLYTDGTTEERRGIGVVDLEGLARRRVLATGRADATACWSPEGKRIAVAIFDREGGDGGRLVVMDSDGSNSLEFPLHDVSRSDMPDWR